MPDCYFIDSDRFNALFQQLKKDYKVFSPAQKEASGEKPQYYYEKILTSQPFVFNAYRTQEPLKAFFTYPYEEVSDYFSAQDNIKDIDEKTMIFGVKNCDIVGHKIQDFVFLEGVAVDSLYRLRRENTLLVSGDCTDYKEVCHCLSWNIMPYAKEGFDLNLAPIGGGYLIDVGSKKGEEAVQKYKGYFSDAKESQLNARQAKRDALVERLKKHLLPQDLVPLESVQKVVKDGYNADTWKQFMQTCVECGGCNLICDTCHCFLLAEKKEGNLNKKVRLWDSCLYANYARVAGGANPLKARAQRLRNRFMKKFDFFVDNLKMPACCGCGRCIEVCPGKIDIREVLKDLAVKTSAKNE
ncbi:MAG: 4Fe-4S dicluster domain-containing protein [Candidatus Omnitrophica bacterium]|nr:4Fe-4S dicluster domain-containing protein [Candidatus Omnitrophota bacterium]